MHTRWAFRDHLNISVPEHEMPWEALSLTGCDRGDNHQIHRHAQGSDACTRMCQACATVCRANLVSIAFTYLVNDSKIHRSQAQYDCSRSVTSTACCETPSVMSQHSNCLTASNLESFVTCTCPRMRTSIYIQIQPVHVLQGDAEGAQAVQGCHHVGFCCSSSTCKLPGSRLVKR